MGRPPKPFEYEKVGKKMRGRPKGSRHKSVEPDEKTSPEALRQRRHRRHEFFEKEAAEAIDADPSVEAFHAQRLWPKGFERVSKRTKPK
jgi:hypothetical protein